MSLEQLIEEVRKYPCLWNKSKEEYRNQNIQHGDVATSPT
jgi:hypothetical protein